MGYNEDRERAIRTFYKHLPYCPLCKSKSGYKITTRYISNWWYFQCLYCKAEWRSKDLHKGQKPIKIELKKLPVGLERWEPLGAHVLNKQLDFNFWQNFEENYDKHQDSRIQSLQKIISETILLPQEEKVITAWAGMRISRDVSSRSSDLPFEGSSYEVSFITSLGLLYITNRRLIWLQNESFIFDLPLEDLSSFSLVERRTPNSGAYDLPITSISVKSTSSKNINEVIRLNFVSPYGKLVVGKQPFTFDKIKKTVEEATQNRRKEIHREKKRIQIILDFSSLKKTLEKGGVIMTTFQCPACNAMLPIPDHGKLLICKYCNAPIKAIDIFEKIKSLLE